MRKLLSFMSYGYVFTKAEPGELQLISSPQQDNTCHLLSLCRAGDRKLISAGLLGLIHDLQQLLYPFRSYSFNCPYNMDLQTSCFSAGPSSSTKKSMQQPNFSCQWVLSLLSLCKSSEAVLMLELDIDFCSRANALTGRSLHPASTLVKPTPAITS